MDHPEPATALSLGRLFARLWRHCRFRKSTLAGILLACAVETAFYWIVPLSFRWLIDDALVGANRRSLGPVLALLVSGTVIATMASVYRARLYAHLQSQIASDIRFQLFAHVQRLAAGFFSSRRAGEITSRFSNDLVAVESSMTLGVTWGLLPALDCVVGTLVLFILDWRLALLASLVWPFCLIMPGRVAPRAASANYLRKLHEADTNDAVHQAIAGHAIVKAYNLEEHAARDFMIRDAALFTTSVRVNYLWAVMEQVAAVGTLVLQVVTLIAGGWLALSGSMTIGTFAAFQALYVSICNSLVTCTEFVRGLLPARAGLKRIDEFLAETASVTDSPDAPAAPAFSRRIEFDSVYLDYQGRCVLHDVSFEIPRGSFTAIVGASGSGKSSLVQLLLRLEDPRSGAVRIDDTDLRGVQQRSWRAQVGVVFQESVLFNTTVRENIRLGFPSATDDMVEAAARAAEAHELIGHLPNGYDTSVGERGGRLSGGERQRIALARALVRNPAILILDEATSALDPQTEEAILRTLMEVARWRTLISVTHRLATITQADQVLVMFNGLLVERGRHQDLLDNGGAYAHLWYKQHGISVGVASRVTPARLQRLPFLRGLKDAELQRLSDLFRTTTFEPGQVIANAGEAAERFYLIARGQAARGDAILHAGDYFGHEALRPFETYATSVRAITSVTCLSLERGDAAWLDDRVGEPT
jgi:ATP-binding cassette, subfamily B, bacterial